jgi:hypothetical protein
LRLCGGNTVLGYCSGLMIQNWPAHSWQLVAGGWTTAYIGLVLQSEVPRRDVESAWYGVSQFSEQLCHCGRTVGNGAELFS